MSQTNSKSVQPNIIVFCTDHMRADYMGCSGHPLIKTPNLDRLAGEGVMFNNIYVQNTVCMPSRSSLITGTYCCRHGVTSNGFNLSEDIPTVADILGDAGYHTMAVGRTHFVCTRPRPEYSKDDFYGFKQCTHAQVYCGNTDPDNEYLAWIREEHPEYYDAIAFANENPDKDLLGSRTDVPEELSLNSWVVKRSLDFIKEHKDAREEQPFFLWAGTWDPHSPYRAPEPWGSMYNPDDILVPVKSLDELEDYPEEIRTHHVRTTFPSKEPSSPDVLWRNNTAMYMGMVSHIDDQIGKLLAGIKEMGLADNTIVVFTSDHGDMLGEHWFGGKVLYFYDAVLKVPCIINGPGVPQGKQVEPMAESIDILPTLLELAGVEVPLNIQGKSWDGLFDNPDACLHDVVMTEHQYFPVPMEADPARGEHIFSIFDGRYRITYFKGRDYGQLFDLETDPDSLHNRWNDPEYAQVKIEMQEKLLNKIMDTLTRPDTRQDAW